MKSMLISVKSIRKNMLSAGQLSAAINSGSCSTYFMCKIQTQSIMEVDGQVVITHFLEAYWEDMNLGVCLPDSGLGLGSGHCFY